MAITIATDIGKMVLARDGLQEQIDAWVAARDAQKVWANEVVGEGVARSWARRGRKGRLGGGVPDETR